MRTTIRIDDEVYRRVKQVADESDRTIGQVIEDAIQLAFRSAPAHTQVAPLPVYGGTGVMPGVDLLSNWSVTEIMEEGAVSTGRRRSRTCSWPRPRRWHSSRSSTSTRTSTSSPP